MTKYSIKKITQSSKGESTLGGKSLWLDDAIGRLNHDGRGIHLGSFDSNDTILLINNLGEYINMEVDLNRRFKVNETQVIEKFNSERVISCLYYDGESKNYFIKRFNIETSLKDKEFKFINESKGTRLVLASSFSNLIFRFNYHSSTRVKRVKEIIVNDFVGVKGWKSLGNKVPTYKRMSGFEIVILENKIENTDIKNDEHEEGDILNLFE